jgi:hypothetical protein
MKCYRLFDYRHSRVKPSLRPEERFVVCQLEISAAEKAKRAERGRHENDRVNTIR